MRTQQNQTNKLTRQEKYAISRQTAQTKKTKYNKINYVLTVLFFSGLVLTYFEILIFRKTVIDWKIPTGIWFFVGLAMTFVTTELLDKYYKTTDFFLRLVFNINAFGGLTVYIFMSLNYYFQPSDESKKMKVSIIKTGHLAKGRSGCGEPYAHINIQGEEKELIFRCDIEIENYKFVDLTVKKGLWGFDIITTKTPLTE
jgi:hypothetical protein